MNIKRTYKFRFYPDKDQESVLIKTFGAARFVYNHLLRLRTDSWYVKHERMTYAQSSAILPLLKKDPSYSWLNEISSVPLQQAARHLQRAFNSFFEKKAGYPKYRSKRGKQSASYVGDAFNWNGTSLKLGRMKRPLNVIFSRKLPKDAKVTSVTVSKDRSGRFFVCMRCDDFVSHLTPCSNQVGIDLGLTHFIVLSTGEKIPSHGQFCRNEAKLARLMREHARKKGPKNREKARLKVARLHASITDSRNDFLHKLSTRLINENQVIAVESLAILQMLKNRHRSKQILYSGWGEFVRQLEYKAAWYGRTLIGISQWYPSSKRCSCCGFTIKKLPISLRSWVCPECETAHDRDINAAKNILAAGLAVSALGESVSPTHAFA